MINGGDLTMFHIARTLAAIHRSRQRPVAAPAALGLVAAFSHAPYSLNTMVC